MDLARLLATYTHQHSHRAWPRQRLLHECLRTAIRDGTLAAGTRLAASRVLAEELHVARNTVLYAYEQLASEGFVITDRRGTVVAPLAPLATAAPSTTTTTGISQRARNLRPLYGTAQRMGAFVPGVPALDQFPMALWRRLVDRAWRALTPAQLNYGDPCGEAELRTAIADHLRAARGVVCDAGQVFITDGAQSGLDCACVRWPMPATPSGSRTPATAVRWRPRAGPGWRSPASMSMTTASRPRPTTGCCVLRAWSIPRRHTSTRWAACSVCGGGWR